MMKKNYIIKSFGMAAAGLLLSGTLTSCNLDDPQNVNTYTFEVLNFITSDNENTEPMLTPGTYSFRIDGNKNLLKIETSNLLFNNINHSFTTQDIRYSSQGFISGSQTGAYISFNSGPENISTGANVVTNLRGALNSTCYPAGYLQSVPIISFNLGGDLTVRTLTASSYFLGQTTLTSPGAQTVTIEEGVYRLIIDYTTRKARLALAGLPLRDLPNNITLLISDLPITLNDTGYVIEKTEATAEVSNNPGDHTWNFTDIRIESTDESMTRCQLRLTLADATPITLTANVAYTLF